MQLTTENTEKYIDNKIKKTAFFVFLCALFYSRINPAIFRIDIKEVTETYLKTKDFLI